MMPEPLTLVCPSAGPRLRDVIETALCDLPVRNAQGDLRGARILFALDAGSAGMDEPTLRLLRQLRRVRYYVRDKLAEALGVLRGDDWSACFGFQRIKAYRPRFFSILRSHRSMPNDTAALRTARTRIMASVLR